MAKSDQVTLIKQLRGDVLGKCVVLFQLAKSHGNVFATDAIIATLMCCTRSVYSWDIIVQRVGKKLFFDKRDGSEFGKYSLNLFEIVDYDGTCT